MILDADEMRVDVPSAEENKVDQLAAGDAQTFRLTDTPSLDSDYDSDTPSLTFSDSQAPFTPAAIPFAELATHTPDASVQVQDKPSSGRFAAQLYPSRVPRTPLLPTHASRPSFFYKIEPLVSWLPSALLESLTVRFRVGLSFFSSRF